MKAISIRQPWAWAILYAGKRCENREWFYSPGLVAQAQRLIGQTILIHASAGIGTRSDFDDAAEYMIARCRAVDLASLPSPFVRFNGRWARDPKLPLGAVVGRARLVDVVRTLENGCRIPEDNVVATCMLCCSLQSSPCPSADPWANSGMIGLILDAVDPLPAPIHYRGKLGFFDVPDALIGRGVEP